MTNIPRYNRFPKTEFDNEGPPWKVREMEHQELLSGFIRLHVLHHATEGDLYGQWMIEELARHGYKVSPGTLYPMLHAMERKGYLVSRTERAGRSHRRIYRATPHGIEALGMAHDKIRELFREVVAGDGGDG